MSEISLGEQGESKNSECVTPSLPEMRSSEFAKRMFASNKWWALTGEGYGTGGMICRFECSVCGLGRVIVLYDINESVEKKLSGKFVDNGKEA